LVVTGSTAQQFFLGQDVQRSLAKAAFEQNIVIFERLSSNGGPKSLRGSVIVRVLRQADRLCEESYRP
jgi:hypothetical protein